MKIKFLLLSVFLVCQTAWAGESDIMFAPESSNEVTVTGDTSTNGGTKDLSFVASSTNGGDIFNKVRKMVEGSFSGVVAANFTDVETGVTEKLEFYGLSVDGKVSLIAQRSDGTLLVWTEDSLGTL